MTGTLLYHNLTTYLFTSVFLLCCGILGILYRRTLIGMLISVELILNGAGLNFVAFNRFTSQDNASGMIFTLFIMGIAAVEVAIALAIIILIFRKFRHIEGSEIQEMKD
jgi:NADH:ubiquinone oxidoreductase subunit K